MKKEDHNQTLQTNEPSFDDAQFQHAMRVDPLTAMEEIKRELKEIRESGESRAQLAAKAAIEKAEVEAQEEKERIIEEQVAQRIAARSKSD